MKVGRKSIIPGVLLNDDPIYNIWILMKQRCYNEKHPHYNKYGGRGIKVCDRWMKSFFDFKSDMGERPHSDSKRSKYSLERIENDGDYTPINCKWATQSEQNSNRRKYGKKFI